MYLTSQNILNSIISIRGPRCIQKPIFLELTKREISPIRPVRPVDIPNWPMKTRMCTNDRNNQIPVRIFASKRPWWTFVKLTQEKRSRVICMKPSILNFLLKQFRVVECFVSNGVIVTWINDTVCRIDWIFFDIWQLLREDFRCVVARKTEEIP